MSEPVLRPSVARRATEKLRAVEADAAQSKTRWPQLRNGLSALLDFTKIPRCKTGIASLDEVIVWLAGTILVLVGPTGRGKTSLALQIGRNYAVTSGPVVFVSAEMSYVALVARAASQMSTSSWIDVLDGQGDPQMIESALDVPDFIVIDQVTPEWIGAVAEELERFRVERPGAVPLVIVDYLQIVPSVGTDDRQRVGAAMQSLIALAAKYRAAVLAISKTARGSSKALRAGESVGDDTTEAGAETNAIEYGATVQLSLGRKSEDEHGVTTVEVNVSKNRYRRGDLVVTLEADLAHGWFRACGAARSGEEVRQERLAGKRAAGEADLRERILAAVAARPDGFGSVNEIWREVGGNKQTCLSMIRSLVGSELVMASGRIVARAS